MKDHDVISQLKQKSKKNLSNKTTKPEDTQPKRPRGRPRKNLVNESAQLPEDTNTNMKSSAPKNPRGRPKKNTLKVSVDNFDVSNKHLKSPSKISKKDTCKDRNALVAVSIDQQQDTKAIEIIDLNSIKPVKPIRSVKQKRQNSNMDGDTQYPKPLAMKFPDDSLKLLQVDEISHETEIVSIEDDGSKHSDLGAGLSHEDQQKEPGGRDTKIVKFSKPQKRKKDKKKPTNEAVDDSSCSIGQVHALALQLNEDGSSSKIHELVTEKSSNQKRKSYNKGDLEKSTLTGLKSKLKKCKLRLKSQDPMQSSAYKANPLPLEAYVDIHHVSVDVASPRLLMCLAHNGEVAWDVKWRPFDTHANSKHRMGQLAVLLGNGALEV